MEGTVIEIKDLAFSHHHGKTIFTGLNMSLLHGERIGLVGPNGSGKTTLMHLIMGLHKPSSGEIKVFGEPRVNEDDFKDVRKRVGLLFQDSDDQLFCPTVREDVAFGPLNLGKTHDEAATIVKDTLSVLGIGGLEDEVTHHLSGGEKRLVALATVIAMRPECYLLDEPTDGLDSEKASLLLKYLKEHASTYLIATHDREFLKAACDRVYELRDGVRSTVFL
jgi:cobalt/nickel transport system ATP-binding protein